MNSQPIHLNLKLSAAPSAITSLQQKLRGIHGAFAGYWNQSGVQLNAHLLQDIGERDERELDSGLGYDAAGNHARSVAAMFDRRI